jgi:hypothetical protein
MRAPHLALPVLLPATCGGPVRVEPEPPSLAFTGREQTGLLHATPGTQTEGGTHPGPNAFLMTLVDAPVSY